MSNFFDKLLVSRHLDQLVLCLSYIGIAAKSAFAPALTTEKSQVGIVQQQKTFR